MRRLQYDKTGNKPIGISTGCKQFDKQTNFLGYGNVIAPTMIGWNIRAHAETKCNQFTFEPGQLQKYDLEVISHGLRIPSDILSFIKDTTKTDGVWMYAFFHYSGNNKVIHGYVIADKQNNHIKTFVLRNEKVVHFAREYVCHMN